MCGIVGQLSFGGTRPSSSAVRRMQNAIVHRGPSGQGIFQDDHLSIGMRRLSIIDVGGGHQPLYNEDRSIVIIGNGEIYNYKELNAFLRKKGHLPRTGSDIETIIHLYEEYGEDCVKKLRGMFAFCLYDTKNHIAILARDRLGEKPLYYTKQGKSLLFASEMKAIVQHPKVHKKMNIKAVYQYAAFYSIPEPSTAIEEVQKLPPGSFLKIDLRSEKTELRRYWHQSSIDPSITGNPVQVIQNILQDVGRLCLRSDVPVGVSLSGGLDSSSVLALCAKGHGKNLQAFTIGYAGRPKSDERDQAHWLASQYGIPCFEREISVHDVVRDFPKTVYFSDDPIADIAAYSIFSVADLAREHGVPVLLGGVGGDELFWGYPWMRDAARSFVPKSSEPLSFYDRSAGFPVTRRVYSALAGKTLHKELDDRHLYQWRPEHSLRSRQEFGAHGIAKILDGWLLSDCLPLGDRMSMAASVELRLPLVDYKLVEAVLSSSWATTAFSREPKWLLKQAMKGILPEEVLQREKKGFTPPVASWLHAILVAYTPYLTDGYLVSHGILDGSKLRILLMGWMATPFLWYSLYSMVVLELWCRMYMEGESFT